MSTAIKEHLSFLHWVQDGSCCFLQVSKLPVYLYNFPANVNSLISAELYSDLAKEFPQLKGIKNTFDDLPLSKTFKEKVPDSQVNVLSIKD